jgi:CheY-like chemotaxis protein
MCKIFYFEEDPLSINDLIFILKQKYGERIEIIIGASRFIIEQQRNFSFDLLILDIMIHEEGIDEMGNWVTSIQYDGVRWHKTGMEFFRRIRNGDYEIYGFPRAIPVIVASGSIDSETRFVVENLGIETWLEKPFTFDELDLSITNIIDLN